MVPEKVFMAFIKPFEAIKRSAKIKIQVNFKPLTIAAKLSILDVCVEPGYAFFFGCQHCLLLTKNLLMNYFLFTRDHLFSTYAKYSKNVFFLTP